MKELIKLKEELNSGDIDPKLKRFSFLIEKIRREKEGLEGLPQPKWLIIEPYLPCFFYYKKMSEELHEQVLMFEEELHSRTECYEKNIQELKDSHQQEIAQLQKNHTLS